MKRTRQNASTSQNSNSDGPVRKSRRLADKTNNSANGDQGQPIVQSASAEGISKTTPPAAVESGPTTNQDDNDDNCDWVSPDYKDTEFFYRETHRCQHCNKIYDSAPAASLCVTSHRLLRCYLCFLGLFNNTDELFMHYYQCHGNDADGCKDKTLKCPFCEDKISYKSVSCHIVSHHLRLLDKGIAIPKKKSRKGAGRTDRR